MINEQSTMILTNLKTTINTLSFIYGHFEVSKENTADLKSIAIHNLLLEQIQNTIESCNFLFAYISADKTLNDCNLLNIGVKTNELWRRKIDAWIYNAT